MSESEPKIATRRRAEDLTERLTRQNWRRPAPARMRRRAALCALRTAHESDRETSHAQALADYRTTYGISPLLGILISALIQQALKALWEWLAERRAGRLGALPTAAQDEEEELSRAALILELAAE